MRKRLFDKIVEYHRALNYQCIKVLSLSSVPDKDNLYNLL